MTRWVKIANACIDIDEYRHLYYEEDGDEADTVYAIRGSVRHSSASDEYLGHTKDRLEIESFFQSLEASNKEP